MSIDIVFFHVITTVAMTIVIWVVQVIIYPMFLYVSTSDFPMYHSVYSRRITMLVAPLMVVELCSGFGLFFFREHHHIVQYVSPFCLIANCLVLAVIWFCTLFLHVPQHDYLSNGWHEETIRALIRTNRIRTALWTLRCALWVWIIVRYS